MAGWLVFWVLALAAAAQGALRPPKSVPEYRLQVTIEPTTGVIQGQASIAAPAGRQLRVDPGELVIHQIKHQGQPLQVTPRPDGLLVLPSPIEITYTVDISKTEDNYVQSNEVVLLGLWYPVVEGFCRFQVTASVPEGYQAVSEAEEIKQRPTDGRLEFTFVFPHPLHETDGVTLAVSNRWVTTIAEHQGIILQTYFFPEHAHLAAAYLERTKKTLEKYQKLLVLFPYRRLALVANAQGVTQAFPTFILMDKQEFQVEDLDRSPLDHEILHQWFGAAVSGDLERGNWFEGLTIYLADHLLMEEKGQGWQCRRRILSGFQAYMQRQREFPLRDFTERLDKHSRVVGYGKGALVFHMLRRQIGDAAFFAGLRRFVKDNLQACASWADLERAFRQVSGQNLTWFFRQWVDETGQPELKVTNLQVKRVGQTYKVNLRLSQAGSVKRLIVPLTFYGVERSRTVTVALTQKSRQASFALAFLPEEVVLDEQYDVFRQLTERENPPTWERLFTAPLTIALAKEYADSGPRLLETLRHKEVACQVLPATRAEAASPIPKAPLLLIGASHPWVPPLFGTLELPETGCLAVVQPHPTQPGALVGLIHCQAPEKPEATVGELASYPFATEVYLVEGRVAWRRLAPTDQGLRHPLTSKR